MPRVGNKGGSCGTALVEITWSRLERYRVSRCAAPTGPVFESLRDPATFEAARVNSELGTVCWANGADLNPDVLIPGSPERRSISRFPLELKEFAAPQISTVSMRRSIGNRKSGPQSGNRHQALRVWVCSRSCPSPAERNQVMSGGIAICRAGVGPPAIEVRRRGLSVAVFRGRIMRTSRRTCQCP